MAVIHRDREGIVIDYIFVCFQLKCNGAVSEILKIRFSRHPCVYAARLIVSIRIKECNIACFLLAIPEEHCANAVIGIIRSQNTVYVIPVCLPHMREHRNNIFLRPAFFHSQRTGICILDRAGSWIRCRIGRHRIFPAAAGYSQNANCNENTNQHSFHRITPSNFKFRSNCTIYLPASQSASREAAARVTPLDFQAKTLYNDTVRRWPF